MRRCAFVIGVFFVAGLNVWAGHEYPAKPGELVVPNELIVRLMPGANAGALIGRYLPGAQIQAGGRERLFHIRVPGGLPNGVSARIAADLQVDFVEPNRVLRTMLAAPNDPNYASSWWWQTVHALQAWSLLPGQYLTAATAGTGRVKVAVLDTGADCTHPDFMNTGGSSTDSAQGGQLMFSASQAFVATTIAHPVCPWQDDHGHGTHVSGILAAATNNGVGVSGLGYPVQVMEYKVLDSSGFGDPVTIANAIEAAADAGAQVVSMSLGGAGYSPTLQTAVNYAWHRNTLVVAAAGNSASNGIFFPADANHAVAVSATDSNNNLASFSNFGNSIQLAAPGVGILSTAPTYGGTSQGWLNYVSLPGTSQATPFVSGLAGLVATSTPNPTAQAILQRMEQTASSTTAGGGWGQTFGYGIISASSAVAGTLRPAANGAIAGQIIDGSESAVTGAQITINNQTITTDSTGLYRFGTLPAGTYPVTVSANNYATQSLSATVAPGADTPFTVTMGVTYGKFTGTVTDQGLGVSGAIVQALSGGLITAVAITDQSGQYTLWVPGAGTYDVRASQIGRITTTVSSLALSSGGTTAANLTLARMGTIAGSVRDGNLNPIASAQVLVTGGGFSAAATTDGSGNYSLIGVPTGSPYSATSTATGFLASTQNGLAVSADATTNVSFTMVSSTVATPTFAPPAATYTSPQSVTISTATAGATIRYTTDGSTPSSTVGIVYSVPVSVPSSMTLRAIAYKTGMTDSPVSSASYVITGGVSNTAVFVKTDTATQGTWKGTYGANGYNIINDTVSYPGYVTVTPANQLNYTWAGSTGDARGLQKALSSTDRIAATWYTFASFTVDLNFNDGAQHQVAIYCLDWDTAGGRAQTISVLDGASNAVLDSQNVSSFQNGKYLVWNLTGHVILKVTNTGAPNATISGLFFDPANSVSTVATPTFAPPAATYSSPQSVTISTITAGASIRYTTDGSTPSSTVGTVYSVPVPVASSMTLKAIAYKAGMTDSAVSSASYVITAGVSNTVGFVKTDTATQGSWKGTYGANGFNVINDTVSYPGYVTVTPASQLNYTWAGSTPDARALQKALSSTDRIAATWYTSGSFTIDLNFNDSAQHQVAVYCLDWETGGGRAQTISVLDGATNAVLDSQYINSFQNGKYLVWNLTGHVILQVTNIGSPNATISGLFFDPPPSSSPVATPTFAPPAATYTSPQSVTISTATAGASIRYTTDGSTPSSTVGTVYSVPVLVGTNLTLKAIAYKTGMIDSAVTSGDYTISLPVATPTFAPPAATYTSPQSVTISTATAGASIRYTTDGSTPSSTVGTVYSVPVLVGTNLTLKAIAYKTGMIDSAVTSGDYTISLPVATPTFAPPAATYSSPQSVTISTATAGASIRYTTDGSTPSSTVGTVYSVPVSVGTNLTLKAIAYKTGMTDSAVVSGDYTVSLPVATPTFAPPAATYTSPQSVTISTATAGASIRYTTDGSTPSSTVGTVYSVPVSVGSNLTLKAIAYKTGMTDSAVVSGDYTISLPVATPTFAPPAATYSSPQSVTISTATAGATIRYTTDGSTPSSTVGIVYSVPVSVLSSMTLRAIAYKTGMTDSPVSSASYVITGGVSNTAVFVKADTATQGTWKGTYGTNGYNVINDTVSYPGYVTVTPANQLNYTWAGSTGDARGLQKALSSTDRTAATWYTFASFTVDLNFNDTAQHQVAIYCLDWETGGGRAQTISVLDGSSNAVLESQNVSSFQNGKYLVWNLSGHVILQVTNTGAPNATISGLFFDPANSVPPVATPTFAPPPATYSSPQSVTISTATAGATIRYTTDGSTPSSTVGTVYSVPVPVTSSMTLKAIAYKAGMTDSTVSSASYVITAGGSNTAAFVKTDTATQGSWKGTYGANGFNVINDTVSYPGYVTVTPVSQLNYTWAGSTPDARGLQKALSSTDRIAATWYTSGSFTIDLNFNDTAQHQVAIYCLDWETGGGRAQTISVLDGSTNAVLDSQYINSFQNGKYLVWNLTGHVILQVTNTGSPNATISGLFFDPAASGSSVARPSR